jgi:hypothetical protein
MFLLPPSEKLTQSNHVLWRVHVLAVVQGAWLAGFIDPAAKPLSAFIPPKEEKKVDPDGVADEKKEDPIENPTYADWVAKDQTVLSYLLSNLGKEIAS